MLPPMDTSATRGQTDADQCELAHDPGADKAAPLDLQARYDRAADCLLWPRLPNLPNTLPWHQPRSQRALLAFNPSWVWATELIAEMTVDISSSLQYLTYLLIA
jgi:hypothetical protein